MFPAMYHVSNTTATVTAATSQSSHQITGYNYTTILFKQFNRLRLK